MNVLALMLAAGMATMAPHGHAMMHRSAMHAAKMHSSKMHSSMMHANNAKMHSHMMAKPTPKP